MVDVAAPLLILGGGAWIVATMVNKPVDTSDPAYKNRQAVKENKAYLAKMAAGDPPTGNPQKVRQQLKTQIEENQRTVAAQLPKMPANAPYVDPQNRKVVSIKVAKSVDNKLSTNQNGQQKVKGNADKVPVLPGTRDQVPANVKKNDSFKWVNQFGTEVRWVPIAIAAQIGNLKPSSANTSKVDKSNAIYAARFNNVRQTYRGRWELGQWDPLVIADWIEHVRAGNTASFRGRARALDHLAEKKSDLAAAVKDASHPYRNTSGGDGTGILPGQGGRKAEFYRDVPGGVVTRRMSSHLKF